MGKTEKCSRSILNSFAIGSEHFFSTNHQMLRTRFQGRQLDQTHFCSFSLHTLFQSFAFVRVFLKLAFLLKGIERSDTNGNRLSLCILFYLLIEYKKQSILFSFFIQNGSLGRALQFYQLGFYTEFSAFIPFTTELHRKLGNF